MRIQRRCLSVVLGALACLAMTTGVASAATYCVNDAACVAAGGTAQPTINAAATLAAADPANDVIRIGASGTPYALTDTVTLKKDAGLGDDGAVQVVGAGREATRIVAPAGKQAFDLDGATLTGLGVTGAHTTVVTASSTSMTGVSITSTSAASNAVALRVFYSNGSSTLAGSTVTAPLVGSDVAAIDVSGGDGSQSLQVVDSTVTGTTAVDAVDSQYDVLVSSSTLVATKHALHVGADSLPNLSPKAQVTSSVLQLVAPLDGNAAALLVESKVPNSHVTVAVSGSTLANLTGQDVYGVLRATASGGTGGNPSSVDVDVDGSVLAAGGVQKSLWTSGSANDVVTIDVTHSSWDKGYWDDLTTVNVSTTTTRTIGQMRFVDLAGGDLHPRHDSPLIDTGAPLPAGPDDYLFVRDRDGLPRWAGDGTSDVGAYEYHAVAPVIEGMRASGPAAPGASVRFDATARDANAGETASLAYAWTLPGGVTATGQGVTATLPSAPGAYDVTLTVTDVTGRSTSQTSRLTVVAPGAPPGLVVELEDVTAPKVRVVAVRASLAKLLAKKKPAAITATATADEPVKVVATLQVVVTPKRGKAKTVVLGTFRAASLQARTAIRVKPTAAGLKKLRPLLAAKGARARWSLATTSTDAAGNATKTTTKVTVGR